jgi:midasin
LLTVQILSAFGFSSGQAEGVRDLVALLQQSFGSLPRWLSDTFKRHLDPFIVPDVEHTPTSTTVGSMWLSLAALLIELYVTDVPIDPAVRRVLLGEVFFTRIELLEEELAVVELSEVSIKGVSDSKRREKLLQRIANVDAERQGLGPTVDRPTDVSRLALFFAEVHSFLRDIASESAIAQLARALAHNERHALDRERAFQLATAAFIQRLTATYTDLEDLARPIVTALLFARFGMRCLARGAEARESKPDQTLIASLAFPPITAAVQLQELHVRSEGGGSGSVRSHFLAALAHAREVNTAEQRSAHIPALAAELDHLYSNWSDARVRENQEAQAAESLYRVKKTDVDVLPEHEQEEKEFAELFPQYEKVTDWDAAAVDTASKTDNQVAGFGASDIAVFHSLVSSVFGERAQHCTLKAFGRAIEQLVSSTFDPAAYTEALDRSSIAYQVAQLHHRQTEIKTAAAAPNFYLNPNEAEVRKAYALVARMIAHLSLLIDQWPEQMVLQHIRDRCDRFLALDARSPVAKILSALEQLLVHADDWEAYASRENSLKGFQSEVSALIVEWRRLELASWMRLLDDQYEQYVATDAEWTLRLYGVLIHDALLAENIDKHIESVLPMMATYLQSSTLGHFGPRLALLTSFELMARELARSLPASSAALSKMATMLHNTAANARLFLGRIEDSLQTQRSVLDEAIKDFVKLASWKDINIYALKASAVKSHRQLLRSIRKFREILQQPIAPVLSDLVSIVPQDEPQVAKIQKSPVFAPASHSQAALDKRQQSAPSPPDHLVRLRDTYSRFSRINQDAIQRVSADATGPSLDTMAVDIIETVEALAKATPSTFTKENATVVNNLASRKRKAFADLLKALRTAGFSQNVRADQLGRQRSVPWLAQLQAPAIADVPEYRHDLDRIESYHYRSAILMRALRAAFNGHNPDISSHDLQRGIGFTESVYASALSERDK